MTNELFRNEDLEQFMKYCTVEQDSCIACGSKKNVLWATSGSYKAVQCPSCKLIWMNPYLNNEGLKKYYTDYIGKRRINNELKMEQRKVQYVQDGAFIENYIDKGSVLDVGCNGGFFLDVLNNNFDKYGVEIDSEAVAFARKNQSFGENIQCCDLENSKFDENQFDLITMRGSIEHVPDPVNSIELVSKLLKSGGYYYVTATPNGDSYSADLYRDKWTLFHPVQHIWHFSQDTLSLICKRYGLKLIASDFPYLGTPYENAPENIKSVADAVKEKESNPNAELPVSPAFWENMMSLVFKKE